MPCLILLDYECNTVDFCVCHALPGFVFCIYDRQLIPNVLLSLQHLLQRPTFWCGRAESLKFDLSHWLYTTHRQSVWPMGFRFLGTP